jgi:hypothetical protein
MEGGSMNYLKTVKAFGLALAVGVGLTACGAGSEKWKEEVVFHDGKVVVVERFFHLGEYPAIDSHNRSPLDLTLTFTLPETSKKILWKTEYNNNTPEPNSLTPLLLDVVDGVPYLATGPAGCIAYNKWSRPNPPYILFKYVNNGWQRIPLEAFPAELVQANLMSKPDSRGLKSYYTVAQVKEQMSGRNMAAEARTILRESVKVGTLGTDGSLVNCEELIPYGKGGWLGLDWFSDQPNHESCLKFCDTKKVSLKDCPCNKLFKGN